MKDRLSARRTLMTMMTTLTTISNHSLFQETLFKRARTTASVPLQQAPSSDLLPHYISLFRFTPTHRPYPRTSRVLPQLPPVHCVHHMAAFWHYPTYTVHHHLPFTITLFNDPKWHQSYVRHKIAALSSPDASFPHLLACA